MLYSDEPIQTKSPQMTPSPIERPGEFKSLVGEFGRTMLMLKEESMTLEDILKPVLRINNVVLTGGEIKEKEQELSEVETWVREQLYLVRKCLERIRNYKERCVL